jgi:hypothetical protein
MISQLDAVGLVDLLRRLLYAEASHYGIARSQVSAPLQVTVPDKGEDASICWCGEPDHTDWLPRRFTLFQAKATAMPPAECAKELFQRKTGRLKHRVQEVLEKGGAYVLFNGRPLTQTKIEDRRSAILTALREQTQIDPDACHIDVFDANKIAQWVCDYAALCTFARLKAGHDTPLGLKNWDQWAEDPTLQNPFVHVESNRNLIGLLTQYLGQPQASIRMTGLSGLGKTRLALEALGPISGNGPEGSIIGLSHLVLYHDAMVDDGVSIVPFASQLCSQKSRGILVVDNCALEVHHLLHKEIKRRGSGLTLLTMDFDNRPTDFADHAICLTPTEQAPVVKEIVRQSCPGLAESDVERIVKFSDGFPLLAVLLGLKRTKGEAQLSGLTDDLLLGRLLWGRGSRDTRDERVLRTLALFGRLGVEGEVRPQMDMAAQRAAGVASLDFYETVLRYERRGLVERRQRFARLRPKPLAVRLASDWFRSQPPESIAACLADLLASDLRLQLLQRLPELDTVPEAKSVVAILCRTPHPWTGPDGLNSPADLEVLGAFAEIDPLPVAELLGRLAAALTTDGFRSIREGRRTLVPILEKLCFWGETFPPAARLLLSLAATENESWANNATGQFLQLFHVLLPGTKASLRERLAFLEQELPTGDTEKQAILIKALGSALESTDFSRTAGVERQGTRYADSDYRAETRKEIFDYWRRCITLLEGVALSGCVGEVLAREELARHLGRLLLTEVFQEVAEVATKVAAGCRGYWPAALESVHWVLLYSKDQLSDRQAAVVSSLEALLRPLDLENEIRQSVGDRARFDVRIGVDGNITDLSAERAAQLAERLAGQTTDWNYIAGLLVHGRQHQGSHFGWKLGKVLPQGHRFPNYLLEALERELPEKGDISVLAGFLAARSNAERTAVKRRMELRPALGGYLVPLAALVKPSVTDLKRIVRLLERGAVTPSQVRSLNPFRFNHLPSSKVSRFCTQLARGWRDLRPIALSILCAWYDKKPRRWALVRAAIRDSLATKGIFADTLKDDLLSSAYLREALEKLLTEGDDALARHMAREVVAICGQRREFRNDFEVASIVEVLLRNAAPVVWPEFGHVLLGRQRQSYWRLETVLEGEAALDDDKDRRAAPIQLIPADMLLEWCSDNGNEAAAVLARLIPTVQTSAGRLEWAPLARTLIDRVGDDPRVQAALNSRLQFVGGWGSSAGKYLARSELLEEMRNHPNPAVRKWALDSAREFRHEAELETKRDEESENDV